jgi:hypothetical protein
LRIFKAAILYFAVVFGAGFIFGVIRLLFVVPRVGIRTAELAETPVMVAVSFFAARWIVRRLACRPSAAERVVIGLVALIFLVAVEFTFVLWVQGLTVNDYIAHRNPVSGTAYLIALGAFALMPLWVCR